MNSSSNVHKMIKKMTKKKKYTEKENDDSSENCEIL